MSKTRGGRKRTLTRLELRRQRYDKSAKTDGRKRPGSHKK